MWIMFSLKWLILNFSISSSVRITGWIILLSDDAIFSWICTILFSKLFNFTIWYILAISLFRSLIYSTEISIMSPSFSWALRINSIDSLKYVLMVIYLFIPIAPVHNFLLLECKGIMVLTFALMLLISVFKIYLLATSICSILFCIWTIVSRLSI